MTLFTHHLAIDQFKSLGRDAHLTTKWIIEQDDEANHGAGEKGDQAAKQEMRSQAQVEHPDQEHVDQRPDRYTPVILYADDLSKTQTRLEDAGARIVKPVFTFPGGRRFFSMTSMDTNWPCGQTSRTR